jgi:CelD/BcsL family acetyltransferase involved in cellulose biosynthesis
MVRSNQAAGNRALRRPCTNPGRNMQTRIQVARNADALAAIVPAWEDLAAHACEANPFYEHWILLPALRAQDTGSNFRCVLVWDDERLIGLFPFERRRNFKGLPAATLTSWRHSAYLLCTPLLRADCAAQCLQAFLAWLPEEAAIAEFRYIPTGGAFHSALGDAIRTFACTVVPTAKFSRALLRKGVDAESYMQESMSSQLRKQLRRKERRLAERKGFSTTVVGPGGDLGTEIERFLLLEVSGWKGKAGGAFASNDANLRFGREVLSEAHRRGRLHMVGIDCERTPVARRFTILAGDGSFAFKTAYDETYASYSPGVLAELLCLREFHRLDGAQWMDSYTDPDNPTVNRMWQDRRSMQHVAVGVGAWGELWLSMLPVLRWLSRKSEVRREEARRAIA